MAQWPNKSTAAAEGEAMPASRGLISGIRIPFRRVVFGLGFPQNVGVAHAEVPLLFKDLPLIPNGQGAGFHLRTAIRGSLGRWR